MDASPPLYDLLVVGGGINGAGIAVDAAGRGLNVALCEMSDLGSATSSASTKLIHGGLRYLEQYEFRLVHEALAEREILLRKAPHIIRPMRFQLPHQPHLRPRWMIRAGLFLYDFLSQRVTLPRSRAIRFGPDSPLVPALNHGFEYSDAAVDDARLVVLNALHAQSLGARVMPRTRCISVAPAQDGWAAVLQKQTGGRETVHARALVNATGPWVGQFASSQLAHTSTHSVRLVKGCHIVVPRLYAGEEAFLLQNDDGRVVFVIPWQQDFTMIGTTEEEFTGDPATAAISEWEIDYLVRVVNTCFRNRIKPADVRHHFAGVRPLIASEEKNPSKVSRDYTLELDTSEAPVLTIYGGKITTYRKLAEAAMEKLQQVFPGMKGPWTANAPLPGGDLESPGDAERAMLAALPWLPSVVRSRWSRLYGTRWLQVAGDCGNIAALGQHFGHGLYAREVDYLVRSEWACTSADVLWRRTKLGLYLNKDETAALDAYLRDCCRRKEADAGTD